MLFAFQTIPSSTAGAISGAGTSYASGAPAFTPVFSGVRVARSLVLCAVFCRSLFVLLSFFFCSLFFYDLRILITPFGYFKLFLKCFCMNLVCVVWLLYTVNLSRTDTFDINIAVPNIQAKLFRR